MRCVSPCVATKTQKGVNIPTSELKREFGAVLETLGFRHPDFSLGQAERPAIRRNA